MSERQAIAIRDAISRHISGRGRRYPEQLRARVIGVAQELRREGRSWTEVAARLGTRVETVRRWCVRADRARAPARMRAVEVVAEREESRLAIVSPSGIRVEGATVSDVLAVLRAFG